MTITTRLTFTSRARAATPSISRNGCSWAVAPPEPVGSSHMATARHAASAARAMNAGAIPKRVTATPESAGPTTAATPEVVTVNASAWPSRAPAISLSQRRPVIQRVPKPIPKSARAPTCWR